MKYFTISELCASSIARTQGIDNTPPRDVIENLEALVDNVLDPLRERYGKAITITSGYRCPALNTAVGGVGNSQHLRGQAADLIGTPKTQKEVKQLFELIQEMNLPIDQCINENNYSWCHVSFRKGGKNRGQFLKLC